MSKRILSVLMSLVLCIGLMPLPAFAGDSPLTMGLFSERLTAQFSADGFKANITKINIGAPIAGTDGKKYLPVTATFTANEDIGSQDLVHFLEGYVKVAAAGDANYLPGSVTKEFTVKVNKAANPIEAKDGTSSVVYNKSKATAIAAAKALAVNKAQGSVTYAKSSGANYFTVNKTTGAVTAKAGTPAGSYKVGVKATAAGNANYQQRSVTKTLTVKVGKAANPMKAKAKAKSYSVKYNKTKATTIKASKLFVVKGAQGAVKYKKASGDAKVIVNKKGKVTVVKATKKGKHTIKVNVTAAGNKNYNAKTVKKVKLTFVVK